MFEQLSSMLFKDEYIFHKLRSLVFDKGPELLLAIVIFLVGRYIARLIANIVERMMTHANYDKAAMTFITQIIYYTLLVGVAMISLNQIGISTTSFIAAFGAFGIAIGLALQNNMANFASGLLILLFKPFKAGDWIAMDDIEGRVESIQFMNTAIATKDNKIIYIPNSLLTSESVTNFSYMPYRVIPFSFDIGYENDHHQAIAVLKEIFEKNQKVLDAEHMEIGIREFADSSVRIMAFAKVKAEDYWPVFYQTMSDVKDTFDAKGINIPYPQQVVYLQKSGDDNAQSNS